MPFHLDPLRDTLIKAALATLDRGEASLQHAHSVVQMALIVSDEGILPREISTGPGRVLPLNVADPPDPDLGALARATGLKAEALDLEGGIGRDLLLITLIDAAEAIAVEAQAQGLATRLVPAGYQEAGEPDLLDADAREVLWEDLKDQLKRLPLAAKVAISEFFFLDPTDRERCLAALR